LLFFPRRLKKAVIAPNVDTKKVSRLQTKDVKNNLAEEDEEMEVKESGRTDSRIIGGSVSPSDRQTILVKCNLLVPFDLSEDY